MHFCRPCRGCACTCHCMVVSVARTSSAPAHVGRLPRASSLFEEVRLMLTGSPQPAAALHRIPNGLGVEGLVIEENQSNSSARVAATFPP